MKYADVNALLCELGQDVIIKDPTTGQERADIVIRTADLCGDKVPSPWISVEERLPERSGLYLVMAKWPAFEDEVMSIVNYDEDAEAFGEWQEQFDRDTLGSLGSEFYSVDVTHWMPLPDLPEVEE